MIDVAAKPRMITLVNTDVETRICKEEITVVRVAFVSAKEFDFRGDPRG